MSKLTPAQRKLLERAAIASDGARFRGPGKHRCAINLQRAGLADLMVGGNGMMSRVYITQAGRDALTPAAEK